MVCYACIGVLSFVERCPGLNLLAAGLACLCDWLALFFVVKLVLGGVDFWHGGQGLLSHDQAACVGVSWGVGVVRN
jgi:hypothetical protein